MSEPGTLSLWALSIVAPGGRRIACGEKTLEVRSWRPDRVPFRDLELGRPAPARLGLYELTGCGDLLAPPHGVPGVREAQRLLAKYARPGHSVTDELIAERRQQAARE